MVTDCEVLLQLHFEGFEGSCKVRGQLELWFQALLRHSLAHFPLPIFEETLYIWLRPFR